jgi:hypothetical protein
MQFDNSSEEMQTLSDAYSPQDYIDTALHSSVCLICSLPLSQRKEFELELFKNFEIREELAMKNGFTLADIEHHLETCVVERDTAIPIGSLISKLLGQVNHFVTEMDKFRIFLDSERNSDAASAYTNMIRELRMTVDSVSRLSSPAKLADQIKTQVIKPQILVLIRSILEKLRDIRDLGITITEGNADRRKQLLDSFNDTAKAWGELATKQNTQSVAKLAEILGVDPRELA